MSVCGLYKKQFAEASHCVFDGHLDDPDFRRVAVQRILVRDERKVLLSESGMRKIRIKDGREYVFITYLGAFGKRRTKGHPFKDENTDAIGV